MCDRAIYTAISTADIGAEFGDVRPLDEVRIRILTVNGGEVLDRIVDDVGFVTQLANAGCITWSQREHLINIIKPRDRNERLTEFLTRRSVADFQKFINVLPKEQPHLVRLFLTDEGEYIFTVPLYREGGGFKNVSHQIYAYEVFVAYTFYVPRISHAHTVL